MRETSLYRYPDTRDKRGQVTSTLGLRWRSPDTFRDPLARVTCRATIPGGHVTSESEMIYLDTATSVTYHHRYSSEGKVPDWWVNGKAGGEMEGRKDGKRAGELGKWMEEGKQGGRREGWIHG